MIVFRRREIQQGGSEKISSPAKVIRRGQNYPKQFSRHQHIISGHQHIISGYQHIISGHQHIISGHQHIISGHQHIISRYQHIISRHQHIISGHQHIISGHQHRWPSGCIPRTLLPPSPRLPSTFGVDDVVAHPLLAQDLPGHIFNSRWALLPKGHPSFQPASPRLPSLPVALLLSANLSFLGLLP